MMAVSARMLEALSTLIQHESPGGALPGVLRGARDTGALRAAQGSSAVGGLFGISNARLNSVKTRLEGLCLLSHLVAECQTDHFQQHCVTWLRSVQHIIQSQDSPPTMELAVFILEDLLKYSSILPELAREISMNHIPGLLTSLLGLKLECQTPALNGMKACMTFYPRACGSLRGKLASCFLSLLDSDNPRLQQLACECYTLLPSLGSGFSQGVKYTECWEHQLHTLLATLHNIVGDFYEGAETDPVLYEGPGLELELPKTENANGNILMHLKNRFTAISKCICLLLRSDFSAPVTVPVQDILDVICRVLNISNRSFSWLGDGPLKMLLLPAIHMEVLDMLSALILACGARLVRFASVLCRLFAQVLTAWNVLRDSPIPGQEKPYSAVRAKIYCVLELWIKICGASSGVLQGSTHHSDVLLAHLLADITPLTDTIKLKVRHLGPEMTGNSGKPASKKQKMADLEDSPELQSHRKQDANANSDVCCGALRVLGRAILLSGSLIKEETHKRLHELVVPLLIRLQQSMGPMTSPYSCAECRKELYHLLLCLLIAPNPRLQPPLHCAIRLFSLGQAEKNIEVLSFCAEALVISSCLIHPRVPSIQIPILGSSSGNADLYKPSVQGPPESQSPFRHSASTPLPIPSASPRPQTNHIGLPLHGNAMISRLPPMVQAPMEQPCSVGTENHNSVPHLEGDTLMQDMHSPTEELFGGKAHRPVFIHYDKEEASDVEISLESDSDDSVVIVPKGFLTKPPEISPPTKVTEEIEEAPKEATAVPVSTAAVVISVPLPPVLAPVIPQPHSVPVPPPQLVTESPAVLEEDLTVININSSDEDEEDEEDYPEDDEFFDDEVDYDEEFDELEEEEEEEEEGEVEEMEDGDDDEEDLEEDYEAEDEEVLSEEEDEVPQDLTSEMEGSQVGQQLKDRRQTVALQRAALQQRVAFQQRAALQQADQKEQAERREQVNQEQEGAQKQAERENQVGLQEEVALKLNTELQQNKEMEQNLVLQQQADLHIKIELQGKAQLQQEEILQTVEPKKEVILQNVHNHEEDLHKEEVQQEGIPEKGDLQQEDLPEKGDLQREELPEKGHLQQEAFPDKGHLQQGELPDKGDLQQKELPDKGDLQQEELQERGDLQQEDFPPEPRDLQEENLREKGHLQQEDLQQKVEIQQEVMPHKVNLQPQELPQKDFQEEVLPQKDFHHEVIPRKVGLQEEENPLKAESPQEAISQKSEPQQEALPYKAEHEVTAALPSKPQPIELEKLTPPLDVVMEVENADEPEPVELPDEAPPCLSPVCDKEDDEADQDDELDQDEEPEEHEGDTDLFMTVESDGGEKMPGEEDDEDMDREEPPILPQEMERSPPPLPSSSPPSLPPLPMDPEVPDLEEEPLSSKRKEVPVAERDKFKERKALQMQEQEEEEMNDAESMLADFIDCPPDEERDSPPGTSS
ncbi:proline-, glutamic acid- and leucine-rich protein 1 [Ambystoma mexicanum]|uniref:proline-, glutamic acid- and leucine-rich protein 1 n=1 Tax=Ambystoma mexicanum TaxID=8296 RepID=UPI0037E72A50